jgi:hypothetical protein
MPAFATLGLLALAALSAAQEQYHIDPESVKGPTSDYWCTQQKSQCPIICSMQPGVKTQNTIENECYPESLTYSCICEDNSTPNITKYTQTLPYFICTEWGNQCVKDCGQDNTCSDKCRSEHPCGAQDPFKPNATASRTPSSSSPSQTTTDNPDPTGLLGETSTALPGAAPAMLNLGASYGMALTFAGFFMGFALL